MGKKKRVLIVEDDRIVRHSLERLLSGADCEIDGVETAEEGLREFARRRHDLILADLKLPGMDGIDMVTEMKRTDSALPFVILSAYNDADDVLRAVKLGAMDYCKKPFDAAEILNLAKKYTQKSDKKKVDPEPPSEHQGTALEKAMNVDKKSFPQTADPLSQNLLQLLQLYAPFISLGRQGTGVTHNLNGPLTGMMGHLELMKLKNPDIEKDLDVILDLTKRLRDLIAEIQIKFENETLRQIQILDLNRILRDELHYLNADLFFKHYIKEELDLDKSLPTIKGVYADVALSIEQILINAIDAQRDRKSGTMKVMTRVESGEIQVQIDDGGPGFTPEALKHGFEPFWPEIRTDDEGRVHAGLGLYLAQRWLEPYHGRILLENTPSGGGRVTVIIPQKK